MQLSHPSLRTSLADLPAKNAILTSPQFGGHAHFWSRVFSRRNFIAGAVGAAGLAMAPTLWFPTEAEAEGTAPGLFCSPSPSPILGGMELLGPDTELFHIFLPAPGSEVSTVGNFKGSVGLASGHGTGALVLIRGADWPTAPCCWCASCCCSSPASPSVTTCTAAT